MHPILARTSRLILYLGLWLPLGSALASLLVETTALRGGEAVALALPLALVYAFACLAPWYLCRALPLRVERLERLIVTQVAAAGVSSALWIAAAMAWSLALDTLMPGVSERFRGGLVTMFVVGVLLALLATASHYVVIALERAREVETRELALQVLAREAELRALRAQIDPPFLFNSLNSISALTTTDPPGARRMCVLLGDFLRRSLKLGGMDRIPLRDEVSLIEQFLAIERVRFGPRLAADVAVDAGAAACVVPPLLLQPLVENAVRHGIAGLVEGGTITVSATRRDDRLTLVVENACDPGRTSSTSSDSRASSCTRRTAASRSCATARSCPSAGRGTRGSARSSRAEPGAEGLWPLVLGRWPLTDPRSFVLTIQLVKLTNWLISVTTPPPAPDSRARLLAAAAAEFAARGFDGANVDRIARAARLNKAMIYYHFTNKAALYVEVFRDMISAVLARARDVAASDATPPEKISAFIRAVLAEAQARPHFAPMWLREVGEGGRHLDRATLDLVRQVPETLGAIATEGHTAGMFRRCHPLLLHFGIVGPIVLYSASQPLRSRFARAGATTFATASPEDLLAHVEHATLATLQSRAEDIRSPARQRRSEHHGPTARRQERGKHS